MNSLQLQKLEINDKKLIQKYMKQFQDFFIPANEHDTFDIELLDDDLIQKSAEIIGQDNPIRVAICEDDKEPESSKFHIHLRIIDGRHRWKQAIKSHTIWQTKFYRVKDYQTYMSLRGHLDTKKRITSREREEYFLNLAEFYLGKGVEPQNICSEIVKDYCPPFVPATVRRHLPYRFKNQTAIKAGRKGQESRYKNIDTIETLQKREPMQINLSIRNLKKTIEEKNEQINFLLSVQKEEIPEHEQYWLVEKRKYEKWDYYFVSHDEKVARKIFEDLKTVKSRLRKVSFKVEMIEQGVNNCGKNENSLKQLGQGNPKIPCSKCNSKFYKKQYEKHQEVCC